MKYVVVVEKGKQSYGAYAPDLPGCAAVGETREEVVALIGKAIEVHLEDLRARGDSVPLPGTAIEFIEVAAGAGFSAKQVIRDRG